MRTVFVDVVVDAILLVQVAAFRVRSIVANTLKKFSAFARPQRVVAASPRQRARQRRDVDISQNDRTPMYYVPRSRIECAYGTKNNYT